MNTETIGVCPSLQTRLAADAELSKVQRVTLPPVVVHRQLRRGQPKYPPAGLPIQN